ncbi:MAG: transcription elongation factor GreA [Propionibacteriaceae bacterium]|jgi:transcription elongation factor GreA|nr:transcription elongation factor GreA [Propionibacteriaceae bacterium]
MDNTIWLTHEAYTKLREEYDYISGEGRDVISKKIARARDEGDLSENAGYHAAREEQGQNELRIRQLKAILDNAEVGEPGQADDLVHPGSTVTIAYDGDPDDTDTFLLGSREVLALDESVDTAVYSPQSPVGQAVLGRRVGDAVVYRAPSGKDVNITIIQVAGLAD